VDIEERGIVAATPQGCGLGCSQASKHL